MSGRRIDDDDDGPPTVVRLPLLPTPDEMYEVREQRKRIQEAWAQQTSVALQAIADASLALAGAGEALDHAVLVARAAGASWTDVGRAAGISRQSAASRWGRGGDDD